MRDKPIKQAGVVGAKDKNFNHLNPYDYEEDYDFC